MFGRLAMGFAHVRASRYGIRSCSGVSLWDSRMFGRILSRVLMLPVVLVLVLVLVQADGNDVALITVELLDEKGIM